MDFNIVNAGTSAVDRSLPKVTDCSELFIIAVINITMVDFSLFFTDIYYNWLTAAFLDDYL